MTAGLILTTPTIEALAALALEAGAVVMCHFGQCDTEWKADGSPVTIADREAEALIVARLSAILPLPVISEEAAADGLIPDISGRFVLVDALDGTKEFVARTDQFTVNIGIVEASQPIAGIVYAPALETLWLAANGRAETMSIVPGAPLSAARNRRSIRVRRAPESGLLAVASLRHSSAETDAFLARLPPHQRLAAGSSVKFCRLAEGAADVYPRFTPTMEWDTAAGDAILRAAGGAVLAPDGTAFVYGKRAANFANGGFVAAGDAAWLATLLQARG